LTQSPDAGTGDPRVGKFDEEMHVKRTLGILVGAATVALGVLVVGYAWTQQAYGQNQTQPAQRQVPLQTRIAIVNLAQVIKGYKKYQSFELELKQDSQGIQKEIDTKRTTALNEQKELEKPETGAPRREQLERDIKRLQREMQDSVDEAKARIQKKEMDQLLQTYREVQDAVARYARAYALELVLQYSDAVGTEMYSPQNFSHKLANRACMPIYVDQRMDITGPVTDMLNQSLASTAPQAPR
jgi:Skp family chaperone for outer membrane proteins